MSRIVLNEVPLDEPHPHETWGDLLDRLDRELSASRQMVTAVRFQGVDEPAFRDPGLLAQRLAELGGVDIETGTGARLMDRCRQDVIGALETLCAATTQVGERFRGHEIGAANQDLLQIGDALRTLMAVVGAAGLAGQVNGGDRSWQSDAVVGVVTTLGEQLTGLVEAQRSEDWLTVADTLIHDIEPTLRRWSELLGAMGIRT